MRVLVLNAGSSSLKASAIEPPATTLARTTQSWGSDASRTTGREAGLRAALHALQDHGVALDSVDAVGHRMVHGGTRFVAPALVDDDAIAGIREVSALAPLHNGVALDTLLAARHLLPDAPHVVCFDTAFHRTLPPEAVRYPVPQRWTDDWGVRRFGFHGLSIAWATREASRLLETPGDALGLIVAHLGSGCSVTAVRSGESVATSMGMTPLEGLMMGTRSGSVDPGMLMQLLLEGRLDAAAMNEALEHHSGLLGVWGVSGDMQAAQSAADSGDPNARLALAMFVRRAAEGIAAMATSLARVDALAFTGGIGEHAGSVRAAIVGRLSALGFGSPPPEQVKAMEVGDVLQVPGRPALLVIEAREDMIIAGAAEELLA
jgi:acetate kinase